MCEWTPHTLVHTAEQKCWRSELKHVHFTFNLTHRGFLWPFITVTLQWCKHTKREREISSCWADRWSCRKTTGACCWHAANTLTPESSDKQQDQGGSRGQPHTLISKYWHSGSMLLLFPSEERGQVCRVSEFQETDLQLQTNVFVFTSHSALPSSNTLIDYNKMQILI